MASNQQALLRQWHMLQLVPRAPLSIEAGELCRRLGELEFPVTKRTVERDLNALSEVFPLVCDAAEPTVHEAVHPLAIVQRGGIVYLACMFGDYEDVRKKEGFDLDAYIASGQFGVIAGEALRLRAVFTRAAGEHLYETPLSTDQQLTAHGDGLLLLAATVPHTRSLVWWLLGFGDGVVVEEPAGLRQEMAQTAAKMARAYA